MTVIDVSITSHHLAVDTAQVLLECLGETGRLSKPFPASKRREWNIKTRRAGGDGCVRGRSIKPA